MELDRPTHTMPLPESGLRTFYAALFGNFAGDEVDITLAQQRVPDALALLTRYEYAYVVLRHGLDRNGMKRTFAAVGARMDRSGNRAHQVHAKAMRKLRHPCILRPLREALRTEVPT
jgi:DNA-directed RNA polymerase sigma subunit (sigma70/sigma32)